MTAKELLLERAPTLTEEQAAAALRAVEEPDEDETVWMPESWKTFEDRSPAPDWTALIRADRDDGH
jgi:hypothetical protein